MANSGDFLFQKWSGSFSLHERRVASSFSEDSATVKPILTRNLPLYSMENSELPAGQVQVLASFIPDLVLNSGPAVSSSKDINPFLAVLLCADISGFTALSETLAKSGDEGAYKLTALVNKILGNMVSAIYENGGDVWKFSGDAFLAFWKVGMNDNYAAVLHRAVFCALQIQKNSGIYETEFKSILRGMSAGCVVWCMVGYNLSKRTILVGVPINEQINAQRKCSSGDVIITASMWSHFNPLYCIYEELDDGKFIKISHMVGYLGLVSRNEIRLHLGWNMKKKLDQKVRRFSELEHSGVRNANLLLCIMSPVIQQMQADLKLDYLTEQRTLTIMFINLLPRKMLTTDLISLVDNAYKIIHRFTMKAGGILDKVSLFDKDVMFVIIFGKNGYVNELRATASLFCGYDIREACIAINGVNNVSVGIATGVCYCGVVGHPQRQEWTVIGSTVNKAARLMTAYVGQITCDTATRDDAELPSYYFTSLETVPLKGFSNEGGFYKFVADKGLNFKHSVKDGLLPLLGREDEMTVFRRSLDGLKNGTNPRKGLLIVGEPKIGKSRLLDEMIIEAIDRDLNPVIVGLRLGHSVLAYTAAVHFLCHVFCINKENVEVDLKGLLSVLLVEHISGDDLKYIDELFDTTVKNKPATEGLKRLFVLAVEKGIKSSVIVIDDAHFCDGPSRELFSALVESQLKFLIFTQESRSKLMENLQTIELQPMTDNSMPALVCQFMNVEAVQVDIIGFLAQAGFCQTQLKALLENGFIQIIDTSSNTEQDLNLIFPDSQLLKRFMVRVPSLEKFPPVREYIEHEWPNDDEFYFKDHLNILAVLGSHVKRQRAASYAGKRLLRQRLRFQSIPKLANSVTNIVKYNSSPSFAEDDFELIGCFSQQTDEILRIYPRDVSISDVVIEESVNVFQKRCKFRSENGSFGSDEEKKTNESDDSQLGDELSEQLVTKLIPKKSISSQNVQVRVKQESRIKAVVRVPEMDLYDCALSESYVSFLTIFDALQPFEQLILKCSSVIGSVFHRPMLDYLLSNNNHFFISRSVAHLFQLNILSCSLSGEGQECICQDSTTDITNFSVHKPGFCEHPCFQHPPLRDVVYEMIPPNVKKMFHERAIEYLTSTSTIRCSSCRLELDKYPYLGPLFRRDSEREKKLTYDEKLRNFLETLSKMPLLDFRNCTCVYTENDTYRQIIQHCDKTGLKEASLKYKVNCAGLKVSLGRFNEAEKILNDVEKNIKNVLLPRKEERKILQELKYLKGKICFENGDSASALRHLFDILLPSVQFAFSRPFLSRLLFYSKNIRRSRIAMQAFNLITKIYVLEGNWEAARHVNATAIKILQHRDSFELCKAYTYLIDITLSHHGLKFSRNFENDRIISAAFSLLPTRHASGAILLGRVLNALYLTRSIGVGDLSSSYAILKALVHISSTVKKPPAQGYLLLEEIHLLVMMGHLGEAHAAILNLGKTDPLLYHALCLDFLRVTGFWIETPEDSRDYLVMTLGSRQGSIDPSAFHRATLSLVLWMFWVNPPKVLDVCALVNLTSSPRPVHSLSDCFVRLMELELMIMEELFVPDNATRRPEILRDWMTAIKIMAQNFQIMLPPFLLMHAYKVHRLAKNCSQTHQILVEAEQVAKKQQNELYIQRIAVCRKDWCSVGESVDHLVQQDLPGHAFVEWPCSNWSDFMLKYP